MQYAIGASAIFTGTSWLEDHVIIVEDGFVQELVPRHAAYQYTSFYKDDIIVPAFIDLQVYGAEGKLFSVFPQPETLGIMHDSFRRQGTAAFMPTVATNTTDVFHQCIEAVRNYWQQGGQGVLGLHLEGPWLHPEKRGAHKKEWIHSPALNEVKDLLSDGKDVIRMITIAPECCSPEVLQLLLHSGIILSAGHSNASYDQAMAAFDAGIPAVTHLFNAMSPLHHRQPGMVGAAFNHSRVLASIIPDGYHADFAAVRIAKKMMGERLFAITDAVTETITGPYRHQRSGDKFECNGVLSGSALSMHRAFMNLVSYAGIPMEEAHRMCSLYPAQLLGMDRLYGKIVPQSAGQFLVLTKQLEVVEMITL